MKYLKNGLKGKEVKRVFEREGWEFVRKSGGHDIYRYKGGSALVPIPTHGNQPVTRGILERLDKTLINKDRVN